MLKLSVSVQVIQLNKAPLLLTFIASSDANTGKSSKRVTMPGHHSNFRKISRYCLQSSKVKYSKKK